MMKIFCNVCNKYKKFTNPKMSYITKTHQSFILFALSGHEYKIIFKEEESIEILKILDLTSNVEEYQKI